MCFRWDVCVPLKFIRWKPIAQDDNIRAWAFGKWLDHESRVLRKGISALIKEAPETWSPLLLCDVSSVQPRRGSRQNPLMLSPWSWTFSPPELCIISAQSVVICYNNPNGLRQALRIIITFFFTWENGSHDWWFVLKWNNPLREPCLWM